MVPHSGIYVATGIKDRLGQKCKIPTLRPKERVKRENSFQVAGPNLLNAIPKHIRNITSCGVDELKLRLDSYLSTIPDETKIRGLMPRNSMQSNSILHQVERAGERRSKCGWCGPEGLILFSRVNKVQTDGLGPCTFLLNK